MTTSCVKQLLIVCNTKVSFEYESKVMHATGLWHITTVWPEVLWGMITVYTVKCLKWRYEKPFKKIWINYLYSLNSVKLAQTCFILSCWCSSYRSMNKFQYSFQLTVVHNNIFITICKMAEQAFILWVH